MLVAAMLSVVAFSAYAQDSCENCENVSNACPQECFGDDMDNSALRLGLVCGDNICGPNEYCGSCRQDCGICESEKAPENNKIGCKESWECTAWSECAHNERGRECYDSNSCGEDTGKPSEIEPCASPEGTSQGITIYQYAMEEANLRGGDLVNIDTKSDYSYLRYIILGSIILACIGISVLLFLLRQSAKKKKAHEKLNLLRAYESNPEIKGQIQQYIKSSLERGLNNNLIKIRLVNAGHNKKVIEIFIDEAKKARK